MLKISIGLLALSLIFFFPSLTIASELNLEASLQKGLEEARRVLDQMKKALAEGKAVGQEINRFRDLTDQIRAAHLLVEQRFSLRKEELKLPKALERHQAMVEGYSRALQDYLGLAEGLSPQCFKQP